MELQFSDDDYAAEKKKYFSRFIPCNFIGKDMHSQMEELTNGT